MPRLDTLLAVHGVHEKSRWRHVGCRRAYDALLEAADLERGARLPSEIRGETVLRALANCGLSVDRRDVSRRLLASILVDVRDARAGEEGRGRDIERGRSSEERPSDAPDKTASSWRAGPNTLTLGSFVSLGRFAALLALQCGGEFDEKLDVLFFAADGSDVNSQTAGRLTEAQTVDALAKHAAPVFKAAARSAGDTGDVEWIARAWRDVVRAHFARTPGSFCDASRFRALASEAMHLVSELAEEEEEEADAPSGGSGAETFPEYVASPQKAPRRQNAGSGPPSAAAAGIADVLASFAGGSHGGSRDGGSASVRGSRGGDERPGHHRRNTSYESAVGDFGGRGSHAGPASFAGGAASSARRHRRGKSEGTALTPARPGGKAEGGVLWQMLSSFSAGYTRGRSKTAGNESEMFDPNISGAGDARAPPAHILSRGAFQDDDGEPDSPDARLSPIDSPRSPRSPSDDLRRAASFGALERVGYSASPDKKQIARRRPRRHSGVSFDADAVSGETKDAATRAADGEASGAPKEEEVEDVEDDDEEEDSESDESDDDDDDDDDDEYAATRHRRVPPKTRAERERLELRLAVASARDETYKAESDQTEESAEFESALAFAQEVGIRMFLYNIVKMLLVIALIAADASICVWTMFHFGIVVGLSVVMVINVGLALLFGFFVLRYTERERGMMHMEYGQHAFKNMTDMFDQNNVKSLGESLAMVQHTLQEGNEQEGARGARGAHKGTRRVEGV